MASEWYVQHGGKQYGPMSAAHLKKLAAERKISPATQVRSGDAGAWVQAAQVKGLFVAAPVAEPAASAAPAAKALPKAKPVAPPLAAPPPASGPLAAPPWARSAQAAASESPGVAAKLLGAVAIILGAVALATFWLPMLPSLRGAIGWTAIVVGGLGLVVGICGLVVAAINQGAGLVLNVAGTSSSAVGLVLAVVLGIAFELFGAAPPRVVVERPTLPAVVEPQPEPPPPVTQSEPEPQPEPEPLWTPADQPIEQPPITAKIDRVAIEQVRLESTDLSRLTRPKPQPMLKIRLTLANTSTDKIVEAPGWLGGGDLVGEGVGQLLGGETAKAVQAATATARLTDNIGNPYKQTSMLSLFGAQLGADHALRPGQAKQTELVFPPPLESIEYLRLELSPAGFGGSEALRFEIPRAMIGGLPGAGG